MTDSMGKNHQTFQSLISGNEVLSSFTKLPLLSLNLRIITGETTKPFDSNFANCVGAINLRLDRSALRSYMSSGQSSRTWHNGRRMSCHAVMTSMARNIHDYTQSHHLALWLRKCVDPHSDHYDSFFPTLHSGKKLHFSDHYVEKQVKKVSFYKIKQVQKCLNKIEQVQTILNQNIQVQTILNQNIQVQTCFNKNRKSSDLVSELFYK